MFILPDERDPVLPLRFGNLPPGGVPSDAIASAEFVQHASEGGLQGQALHEQEGVTVRELRCAIGKPEGSPHPTGCVSWKGRP